MEEGISPSSEIQNNDKTKLLGIEWDTINDYLIYSFEDLVENAAFWVLLFNLTIQLV